jgi:hypothetical protein
MLDGQVSSVVLFFVGPVVEDGRKVLARYMCKGPGLQGV